jgi:hypothetical protein
VRTRILGDYDSAFGVTQPLHAAIQNAAQDQELVGRRKVFSVDVAAEVTGFQTGRFLNIRTSLPASEKSELLPGCHWCFVRCHSGPFNDEESII